HPVGLGHFVAGVGNAGLKPPIVREQKQAFAIAVQPPGRVNVGNVHEALQCFPTLFVRKLTEDVKGFVERNETGLAALCPWAQPAGAIRRYVRGGDSAKSFLGGVHGWSPVLSRSPLSRIVAENVFEDYDFQSNKNRAPTGGRSTNA